MTIVSRSLTPNEPSAAMEIDQLLGDDVTIYADYISNP